MSYEKREIKKGIKIHKIETNKFKTNYFAVFLTTPTNRENVTKNELLTNVLSRGTMKMKTQEDISKRLEELYGATLGCGVEKFGDNSIFKFSMDTINSKYSLDEEDLIGECLEILFEVIFNPLVEKGKFNEEYVKSEKENLRQIIDGRKDNKAMYAYERCLEEMYKGKIFGLQRGYSEDLEEITSEDLYNHYKKTIDECKIDIVVSGEFDDDVMKKIEENEYIKALKERNPIYNKEDEPKDIYNEHEVIEKMDVNQGKLIIGLDIKNYGSENYKNVASVYNAILGGGANSKLFQNVREKASLAYSARSNYLKRKDNIVIKCGIEIENYQKAMDIIRDQLDQIKNGNFTDEDFDNAKELLISIIRNIKEEQTTEVANYIRKEILEEKETLEEYMEKISKVKREEVEKIAQGISINTIYFLRN